eukprot:XP_001701968.1 predicted protein [Chlamydomonas reinhardtii]
MIQAQTRGQVVQGVQAYGLAPGARKMIDAEEAAAQLAMQTGLYGVWRSAKGTDCTRIGPTARCFCNHPFSEHFFVSPKSPYPICKGCSCRGFAFIPSRLRRAQVPAGRGEKAVRIMAASSGGAVRGQELANRAETAQQWISARI